MAALLGVTMPIVVAGCSAAPPGASPSPSQRVPMPPITVPTTSVALPTVFGPDGVGALRLGMTKSDAAATGLATGIEGTQGTCGQTGDGRLFGTIPAADQDPVGKLYFATDSGTLVAIEATEGMLTQQGVGLGSTLASVKKAYPKWKGDDGGRQGTGLVTVPGNPSAVYRIYLDAGHVMELTVQLKTQRCVQ